MPTKQALNRIPLKVVLSLAFLSITTFTQAQTWVFTDQALSITSPGPARIILLDQQQHLESELSRAPPPQTHTKPPRASKAASTPPPANAYKPISPKPSKI